MFTLTLINESFTNGYRVEILYILSLVAILSGILVIISQNPIVSVLFLMGLFLSIASYLIILGLSFIGLSYLLVYVGAVAILSGRLFFISKNLIEYLSSLRLPIEELSIYSYSCAEIYIREFEEPANTS
jgi:hypothetical protein